MIQPSMKWQIAYRLFDKFIYSKMLIGSVSISFNASYTLTINVLSALDFK